MNETYAVVAHRAPRDPRPAAAARLRVAVRIGCAIEHIPLQAMAPDYETARAEAQAMFPKRTIVVPSLGEEIPS